MTAAGALPSSGAATGAGGGAATSAAFSLLRAWWNLALGGRGSHRHSETVRQMKAEGGTTKHARDRKGGGRDSQPHTHAPSRFLVPFFPQLLLLCQHNFAGGTADTHAHMGRGTEGREPCADSSRARNKTGEFLSRLAGKGAWARPATQTHTHAMLCACGRGDGGGGGQEEGDRGCSLFRLHSRLHRLRSRVDDGRGRHTAAHTPPHEHSQPHRAGGGRGADRTHARPLQTHTGRTLSLGRPPAPLCASPWRRRWPWPPSCWRT